MKQKVFDPKEVTERENLYMACWRILARFGRGMVPEEKSPFLSIVSAFYRDRQFDPLAVAHVQNMKFILRQSLHHPHFKE